jgi:hypothetical protein
MEPYRGERRQRNKGLGRVNPVREAFLRGEEGAKGRKVEMERGVRNGEAEGEEGEGSVSEGSNLASNLKRAPPLRFRLEEEGRAKGKEGQSKKIKEMKAGKNEKRRNSRREGYKQKREEKRKTEASNWKRG